MRNFLASFVATVLISAPAFAGMVTEKVAYALDGTKFEGVLVYDDGVKARRPLVVMAPNWMGVTENAVTKARLLAGKKYVFFIADMYGVTVRPKNAKEAGAASGAVRRNLALHRARINKAVDVALDEGGKRNLIDASRVAAIGFCFGGGNVLELARSGRNIKAVVTFHGSLTTPKPEDAKNIKAKILVLHGADDPAVPKADRDALEAELKAAKVVDYQIVVFSNTVHSFTNPEAHRPGRAMYNPTATKRAYRMMNNFFDDVL